MVLTTREKCIIAISHAMILYSASMRNEENPGHKSVIDFILKNIPQELKSEVSMELIDNIFEFISNSKMELS